MSEKVPAPLARRAMVAVEQADRDQLERVVELLEGRADPTAATLMHQLFVEQSKRLDKAYEQVLKTSDVAVKIVQAMGETLAAQQVAIEKMSSERVQERVHFAKLLEEVVSQRETREAAERRAKEAAELRREALKKAWMLGTSVVRAFITDGKAPLEHEAMHAWAQSIGSDPKRVMAMLEQMTPDEVVAFMTTFGPDIGFKPEAEKPPAPAPSPAAEPPAAEQPATPEKPTE